MHVRGGRLTNSNDGPSVGGQQAGFSPEARASSLRPMIATPIYIVFLAMAVTAQSLWVPTWLVSSHTSVQTVVQALPTALIALFALAFATLFVAVQQVTSVFSSRAPLILASDPRVRRIVARTIIITALSLILGAIIPDPPKPLPAFVTAAGTTLLIASALLIYSYGRFALLLIIDYSAPRSFVEHVVTPVTDMIARNKINTGHVLFRVPLLGQTLRYALTRDDAETFYASLEGLDRLQKLYVGATLKDPSLRNHLIAANNVREHWLADELYRTYMGACEEALRLQSPQHEIDHLVDCFGEATLTFVRAHQETESKKMMTGVARLSTSPYQVAPGVANHLVRPASTVANVERCAEQENIPHLASCALANWAVAISYPQIHFGYTYHPLFQEGVRNFGPHPPWDAGIELLRDPSWSLQWLNQLQYRMDVPVSMLELARDLHEGPEGETYTTRKRSVYHNWLTTTSSAPTALAIDPFGFNRKLEGVNHSISLFGSSEVKEAVTNYFASYQNILSVMPEALAASHGDRDLAMQAISNAFGQDAVAKARDAVLKAMSRDLGEELHEPAHQN
jgi:hypothetical protein